LDVSSDDIFTLELSADIFEDNGILRNPGVAKSSFLLSGFKKYATRCGRVISKNTDLRVLEILVDRLGFEFTDICLPRRWKIRDFVEVRVLFQSKTPLVLEAAEVPKNFLEAGFWTKYLWRRDQILGGDINELGLTPHNDGTVIWKAL